MMFIRGLLLSLLLYAFTINVYALNVKGIYINQSTLENVKYLKYLIAQSKSVGINTFIVDLHKPTPNYQKNINLIKESGINYVARVVVFPDGGKAIQVRSPAYWAQRLKVIDQAIKFGANEIQLDYIRYSSKQPASSQNAHDVKAIIKYFKKNVSEHKIPLQIDVFGEVSFKESPRIGQNIKLFADTIDVACPMVYPSHYAPFAEHSATPYKTVFTSLEALKKQFKGEALPFKLRPFIEASNYHYKMNGAQKAIYVLSQIKAAEDAKADGWYVWSPNNFYDSLFSALKNRSNLIEQVKKVRPLSKTSKK